MLQPCSIYSNWCCCHRQQTSTSAHLIQCTELNMAIMSVSMPAVTCCSCVDKEASENSLPQSLSLLECLWDFPADGITIASCWRFLSQSLSRAPCSHANLVACRAPDHHQGMTKIWEIKTFFWGLFVLGGLISVWREMCYSWDFDFSLAF